MVQCSTVLYSMVQCGINIGSQILVPRPNIRGIPEVMLCRILCLGDLWGPTQGGYLMLMLGSVTVSIIGRLYTPGSRDSQVIAGS